MKSVADLMLRPMLFARICLGNLLSSVGWIVVSLATFIRIRRFAAKFPVGEKAWPVIGDMHVAFFMDEPSIVRYFIDYLSKRISGVVWLGIIPFFYVWDPRDVERVLSNPKSQNKPSFYRFLEQSIGKGLITLSGGTWQRHHRIISPTFRTKMLDSFVPIFNRQVDTFINILRRYDNNTSFDVLPLTERLALDIICEAAMGINMKMQLGSSHEYMTALETLENCILERTMRPWLHPEWIYALSSTGRRAEAAKTVTSRIRNQVIHDRKKILLAGVDLTTMDNGEKQRLAFLDHLLLSVKAGACLSDEEIAEEVDTFMAAGADTTSLLIGYCLFEIARNPNIQQKVLEELMSIYDTSLPAIDISAEDLNSLTYLEMVLKETLRLHPPVPIIARSAGEDIRLASCDLTIPANAQVAVISYFTHRSSNVYTDPMKFDPERFQPENFKDQHPYAFLPFGAGKRICMGRRLTMLEAKVAVAKAVRLYEFFPDPEFEPADRWGMTLKPMNGLRLKIRKRR